MPQVCSYLKHLCCTNDWLAGQVALCNHHLLSNKHLASGDLDTQIPTSHHDTVRSFQYFIKVLDTLLVLDFDDDLDACAVWAEHLTDISDILRTPDERRKNHIDVVLQTKPQVLFVFFRECRQVDGSRREIYALSRRKSATIDGTDFDILAFDGKNGQRKNA